MKTREFKINDPESWEDKSHSQDPESWTSEIDELGEIQNEVLDELVTKRFGVVISPIFKTASGGERIHIFKGAMKAYDENNRVIWQLLQNTDDNVLTLIKRDDDGYGNALNIQDDSDDIHGTINVEYTGNSDTKDLLHLELAATMTEARVGQSIEQEGGTTQALFSAHAKAGTADNVMYLESDIAGGKVLTLWSDNASNTDAAEYIVKDGAGVALDLNARGNGAHIKMQGDPTVAAPVNGELWLSETDGEIYFKTNDTVYKLDKTAAKH